MFEVLLTIGSVVVGAVLSLLIVMWVENQRRPRLRAEVEPPADMPYGPGLPASFMRALRVRVRNEALPWWAAWMTRESATCRAQITFHYLADGVDLFGRAMAARWSDTPQPITVFFVNGQKLEYPDTQKVNLGSQIDIPPGESEPLDVIVRCDKDDECYGWSNQSYFSNPPWRNPEWKIPKGRYIVKITVRAAGQRATWSVSLNNDLSIKEFRFDGDIVKQK